MAQMKPLGTPGAVGSTKFSYDDSKYFVITNSNEILNSNKLFTRYDIEDAQYDKYARFGMMDPYHNESISREFLFFTKPDLNLFNYSEDQNVGTTLSYNNASVDRLAEGLKNIPFFTDAAQRHKDAMLQLQYSVQSKYSIFNPFMYLLSNRVTSKLELPAISAENQESTANLYGNAISYRSHSIKSDYSYDFSLSFTDTNTLDVYYVAKIYDEYMRLCRTGEVQPKQDYIMHHILPEQFSIYKFLIGEDGETILYYAKLTGVYFTDVPRGDFGDPETPFKFSLGFHAQYVEDNNPSILIEFNEVSWGRNGSIDNYTWSNTYSAATETVSNIFAWKPLIIRVTDDYRANAKTTKMDYRLTWVASKY